MTFVVDADRVSTRHVRGLAGARGRSATMPSVGDAGRWNSHLRSVTDRPSPRAEKLALPNPSPVRPRHGLQWTWGTPHCWKDIVPTRVLGGQARLGGRQVEPDLVPCTLGAPLTRCGSTAVSG